MLFQFWLKRRSRHWISFDRGSVFPFFRWSVSLVACRRFEQSWKITTRCPSSISPATPSLSLSLGKRSTALDPCLCHSSIVSISASSPLTVAALWATCLSHTIIYPPTFNLCPLRYDDDDAKHPLVSFLSFFCLVSWWSWWWFLSPFCPSFCSLLSSIYITNHILTRVFCVVYPLYTASFPILFLHTHIHT